LVVPLAFALPFGLTPGSRAGEPASPRAAPGEVKGTLVIVGGGPLPDDIRLRFLELAGGANAHLVIIPTASGKTDPVQSYKGYAFWKSQKVRSVEFLHTRRRAEADDPAFVRPLAQATGVWFSGGDQTRLIATYHGTAVEREVHRVLERGGVVGGTSAGAAVMSPVMIVGGTTVAELGDGFGFLPGVVVDQHFRQRNRAGRLLGVLKKYPQYLGIGIDEKTAVVVHGHSLAVMGESNVRVYMPVAGKPQPREEVLDKASKPIDLDARIQTVTARYRPEPVRQDAAVSVPHAEALSHGLGAR
jgi:cyanophycinase